MVLDQFNADLDPAFLAHRACLPNPDDVEQQIVGHVAEELRGLMDSAVAEGSPAGSDVVERWIRRKGEKGPYFVFGDQQLDLEQTILLAKNGLVPSALGNNAFEGLSAGFACHDVVGLDERLAWIMSSRTVYHTPPPTLWLGSLVTESSPEGDRHLICMRPRCDCLRLQGKTSFFFLPLLEPKKDTKQVVLKLDDSFERLSIALDSATWVRRQFKPSAGNGRVTAQEVGGGFEFRDTCTKRYTWRGELKPEYTLQIAQTLANTLSRVAIDESEWLRRIAKTSR